jgi:hypothetical protein
MASSAATIDGQFEHERSGALILEVAKKNFKTDLLVVVHDLKNLPVLSELAA